MGKTANLELNTTEMSDKISDFVSEYNSNMNMLDDLYGDVQDDASTALSTAQSAETKATAAQTAATNAVTTANSANTTAQSAVSTANSANTTAGQANTKADNAVATANTAKDTADEAKETAETASADVADKADVDGTYDSFTAGGAKQLLSTVYVDDNEPYNFRTSGGSADIGDRMYEEVVGGTVVWNSLIDPLANVSQKGVTVTCSNGLWTFNGTSTSGGGRTTNISSKRISAVSGHWYLFFTDIPTQSDSLSFYLTDVDNSSIMIGFGDLRFMQFSIVQSTFTGTAVIGCNFVQGGTYDFSGHIGLYDLTAMFGSTIADYVHNLEQGTAGAGVAWFRKLFPKPYYEYNAGELMSVKAGSHDTVGFNQFDKSTAVDGKYINPNTGAEVNSGAWVRSDYIRVVPNTVYYTNADGTGANYPITLFDADKNFIGMVGEPAGPRTFNTGDARYVILSTLKARTSVDDLVLNLAWDGERNGEYEPYEKHTYPLAELELRGIPKLDANNQLYYDGDTYASDGTVTRKYGIIDLGTVNWNYASSGQGRFSQVLNVAAAPSSASIKANIICTKYETLTPTQVYSGATGIAINPNDNGLWVHDSAYSTYDATTASQFKQAMSGVYLVYELATPTTETADTFVNPQVVDDFGTEEYVDYAVEAGDRDVAIPVGHNSQYMNNLRAKLEMAPDSPDGDGKYIVQQPNGENAYVPYTADGRLDAIEAKLPAPPSANGTYRLTAVVSNNGVTYSWQS